MKHLKKFEEITKYDALNALDIINRYVNQKQPNQVQQTQQVQPNYEKKTLISDWIKENNPSTRLKNVLKNYSMFYHSKYIDDITYKKFISTRGAGKNTWEEFKTLI